MTSTGGFHTVSVHGLWTAVSAQFLCDFILLRASCDTIDGIYCLLPLPRGPSLVFLFPTFLFVLQHCTQLLPVPDLALTTK
jgi:hypothetical protein